jgi:2'-5' RNA ligase
MKEGLYFIAILPPPELAEKVQAIKKEFVEKYDSKEAYRRPAHFTLQAPFEMPEADEEAIIPPLLSFAKHQQAFTVRLADFNHFRDDVIFIDVEDPSEMKSLHQNLISFLQNELDFTDGMIKDKNFRPHMTVAYRDLSTKQFHQAWAAFSSRSFDSFFKVNSFFLLKHDDKQWQPLQEFNFGDK